jgi:ATP/maltotriose-dependent transcriptional regulator MalT
MAAEGGAILEVMARVTSSRLIGREAELAELEAALADAGNGCPSLAFVAGESGVGKSRLLADFERRAHAKGVRVLSGECVDLGEGELPYAPLVGALRPLARSGDPALVPAVRAALGPLLPGTPDSPPGVPAADPTAQARLFEGLLSLLEVLGADAPVLLVIEDLHWADRSTRACIMFLARSLATERVLVVTSYRPDELHRRHPLRPLLAELERDPRSRRIGLDPLSREELGYQLADILGGPPDAELLERMWKRSGGNPLFCEELLAAGLDGRGAAPDTLRDALMLRVERLSDPAQELLRVVAIGQRLDHTLLAETTGFESRALHDALRETVDGHILKVDQNGMHRFRHALLREVVEDDLLPGERAALHLSLARVLERRIQDGNGGALMTAAAAHHFAAAGDQPAALAAGVRAAAAAERVYAHGEALALLERALELWDRVPDPEAHAGADRVDLLMRAGDAAQAVGDPVRQLSLLEAAFEGVDPQADPRRAARILERTAKAKRSLNRAREGITTLERALALVDEGDGETARERARVLAVLARARMLDGHFSEAVALARKALAEGADADPHARNTLGCSLAMLGEVEAGAAEMREAIRIARARDHHESYVGEVGDLADAYVNYADMLHVIGRTAEAKAIALEGRQALDGRRPVASAWLDTLLAEFAYDSGEWDEAEAYMPAPQRWWTGKHMRTNLKLCRATLALGRGDHATAKPLLAEIEDLAKDSSEPQYLAPIGVRVAELHRREGDLDAARAAVERTLDQIEFCTDDAMRVAAVAAIGVTVEADAAERARDLGDAEEETAALRCLDDLLARVAAAVTPERPVERALLLGARADATRAAGRPRPDGYAAAAAAFEAIDRPESVARMRWREAEAHLATGDREAAADAARAASEIATRLGAGWLRGEIESLAARGRLVLDAPTDEPEVPEDEDVFGLTERERQVLALVAEGATNREIGATLFMAEKTASVHVSRILGKLGVRTRTEAAAVAHRVGLTSVVPSK